MSNWVYQPAAAVCQQSREAGSQRQQQLTKPPGSLGFLEAVAVDFCGWQKTGSPTLNNLEITVFAADHGVVAAGVSAFPQSVTAQMVSNFSSGGAAISVLARTLNAEFRVVNLGTVVETTDQAGVINLQLAPGSSNFCQQPAMSAGILQQALQAGFDYSLSSTGLSPEPAQLFIGGEMGIGNTTSAAALICALTGKPVEEIVGRGTGVDNAGLKTKQQVVQDALAFHQKVLSDPLEVLRCLGGFEIAALVGAYIGCAQRGVPSLVDGFIATAAALVACRINPSVREWLIFSHQSAESGHAAVLAELQATPLIHAQMRLGEGSGAALTVPLLQMALQLHNQMATFEQAGVSKA